MNILDKLVILPRVLHYSKSNLFLFSLIALAIAFFLGMIVREARDLKNYTFVFFIRYVLCEITLSAVRSFPYRHIFLKAGAAILGACIGFFISMIVTKLLPKKNSVKKP
ncbi:MAG: hypothetical protein IJ733_05075 [Lachnospiraceae bacterium]|nr:hypothetical protein [Lachnospiraceae bacterium]